MRLRAASASASLLLGVALVATPVASALADAPAGHGHGHGSKAHAAKEKAKSQARRAEHALGSHHSVVVGGALVSVTPGTAPVEGSTAAATPGSLVVLVHGHKFKALRGTAMTVTVSPAAKVTREGSAQLGDLVAGDHVVVRLTGLDLGVVRGESGGWEITGTATAVRVAASPAETTDDETSAPADDPETETAQPPSS